MKRHPALIPLSRDHHHALVIARRLRAATPETADDTTQAFLAHWDTEEKLHFRIEEELLLPAYAAHGDPNHHAVSRTLLDHMLIRRDAERLALGAPLETLHDLGERLQQHVNLEEHELFPLKRPSPSLTFKRSVIASATLPLNPPPSVQRPATDAVARQATRRA